ncbi:hypothetical protein BaRGS_00028312 [Batillaria attramentaria]|uniref:Uncharacterized protein n=1 Tax=Batillaria attramentaria TaxID=370345 RepID=A0ABD0JZQ4_9CAEN
MAAPVLCEFRPFHAWVMAQQHRPNLAPTVTDIREDLIEKNAHVVFDWDNTLKLYDKQTGRLRSRVSRDFLVHLKRDLGCRLYIISAIRPSRINLSTILTEVERLGLTDVFVDDQEDSDDVDGTENGHKCEVKPNEYAREGNVIICGYDKAETFLRLASFDADKGDKVIFFDDEEVNIENFEAIVPNSKCYLAV